MTSHEGSHETGEPMHQPAPEDVGSAAETPPMSPPTTAAGPGVQAVAASRAPLCSNGKRFGAYLLDVVLMLVTLVIGWWVWSVLIWQHGQTPAKQLLKMRCVDASTRETATWGAMALREVVGKYLLGTLTSGITTLISAFMILLGDDRQGIWDKIASTTVVDDAAGAPTPR